MLVVLDMGKVTKKDFWIPLLKFTLIYATYYFLEGVFFSLDAAYINSHGLFFSTSYIFLPFVYIPIFLRKDGIIHKLLKFFFLASTIMLTNGIGKDLGMIAGALTNDNAFIVAFLRALPSFACLGAAFIIYRFNISRFHHLSKIQVTMFLILSLASIILTISENILSNNGSVTFTIGLYFIFFFFFTALLIENFLMYFYFYYSVLQRHQLIEKEMQVSVAELENEALKINKANLEELAKYKHDTKNQYSYLNVLLEENKIDDAKKYLHELIDSKHELFTSFQTQNSVINGIMNLELTKANLRGVQIQSRIIIPPILPFKDIDLVSLITNIIDNALENVSMKEEHPSIKVTIFLQEDYLRIYCLNKIDENDKKRSMEMKTKKGKKHGYGTKIIKEIVTRYGGYVSFKCENDEFVCDCILALNASKGGNDK